LQQTDYNQVTKLTNNAPVIHTTAYMLSHVRLSYPAVVTLALLSLMGAGCSSLSGPGSASFASVTIADRTPEEIAATTTQVFVADGYRGGLTKSGQLLFEKEASRATSFAREGLVGAYYGGQTINRVRAEIVPLGHGSYRLQCKAFMVTGGPDPFFQDEVPVTNARSGPYRSLLRKVEKQLKPAGTK
jgi:hypothetical protein